MQSHFGGGTTAVACVRLSRGFVGVELDLNHAGLALRRADREIIMLWLREIRVAIRIETFSTNDLDPQERSMDRIGLGRNSLIVAAAILIRPEKIKRRITRQPPHPRHRVELIR
ncbi:MAG: hypothetical protein DME24_18185 [Verrucomicrobia bacterium]|nr:MAG: hypothetical protein DME24_18185 [Verrucomicrobiota bacterium]